jgi:GT2 family glycosyltransferase
LRTAIEHGAKPALPAIDPKETRDAWIHWHEEIAGTHPSPVAPIDQPLVTVCLTHRNRPQMLAQAIESLRRQDYPRMQVVLVDDGSDAPDALAFLTELEPEFSKKGWKLLRQPNRYLGAARNAAAKIADGQWLLFMDDDNYAAPDEISTFVKAALCSGADILTCFASCFREKTPPRPGVTPREIWLPIGGAVAVGAFTNIFGDANGLYRREIFDKLGGFSEDAGVGHEDWELYAKAALTGHAVMVVPRPLFWYREHSTSMLRTTDHYANHMRSLRPYFQALGPDLSPALLLAQSMYFSQDQPRDSAAAVPASFKDFEKNDPQQLVDDYWNSLSWRVTGFARRAFAKVMHIPVPPRPQVNTRREAMNAVDAIRRSISWEATGPLRVAGRLFNSLRHRRNGSAE